MTAREMFELEGFILQKSICDNMIVYKNDYGHAIKFYLNSLVYESGFYINMMIHKAIYKQIEELGWLE